MNSDHPEAIKNSGYARQGEINFYKVNKILLLL